MSKKENKFLIIAILSVLIGIPTAIYYLQHIDLPNFTGKSNGETLPIIVIFEPGFINEGQHDKIPIKITIKDLNKLNVTSLELAKDNVEVDRLNKSGQVDVASYISWKNTYNQNYIFLYNSHGYSSQNELSAEGELIGSGCKNCFMGESYPYQFAFVIKYKINDGPTEHITINKIVRIVD